MKAKLSHGFNLIELIIFMLIMSILVGGFLSVFSNSLAKTPNSNNDTIALLLAQQRMEIILRQKRDLNFSGFLATSFDPCTRTTPSTLAICTSPPTGFSVNSNFIDNWLGNTDYKHVTVTVSGSGHAKIESLVANF